MSWIVLATGAVLVLLGVLEFDMHPRGTRWGAGAALLVLALVLHVGVQP